MSLTSAPSASLKILLDDAVRRDPVTARRLALLGLLLHERYLTREQLIARVEGHLGRECFGAQAWEDTFFRDMHVVKKALQAAGFRLAYSRRPRQPGYYLAGQPSLSPELSNILRESAREVDPAQLRIFHSLKPAGRFYLAYSATDAARSAAIHRYRQQHPEASLVDASLQVHQKASRL